MLRLIRETTVRMMRYLLGFILLLLTSAPVRAQEGLAPAPQPGEELRVFIMTMGPGQAVWERFGHNAIRIRDEARGTDIAYNYGMFSFDQESFLLRFVRGQMDYWMEGFNTSAMVSAYIQQDRSVWMQELNLDPAQKAELRDFLDWNSRPENTFYRYDYYLDNCSTRVRDAIDRVLGGQIRERTAGRSAEATYREHTRSLTGSDLAIYTGLMAGLGQPVDREISVWEEMFLPLELRDHLNALTVLDSAGREAPLVLAEDVVYLSSVADAGAEGRPGIAGYLLVGVLFGMGLWLAARFSSDSGPARLAVGIVGGGWSLLAGVLGMILLGLWLLTDHATSYQNENLFHFSPLLLPVAILLPFAILRGGRAHTAALALARSAVVLSLLGFLLQLAPGFSQANGELIALTLPLNVGLALALYELRLRSLASEPAGARQGRRRAATTHSSKS
jgi:hypothetical protein